MFVWLIGDKKTSLTKITSVLSVFKHEQNYVLLQPRSKEQLLALRKKRLHESQKKWKKVPRIVGWLAYIPTVEFVGISGGLAMNNADDKDDIDLFIIVSPATIWITRFFVVLILECLRVRRRYGSVKEQDLFCPNMFMSLGVLTIPHKSQDLYSAHEVLQMVPVFDRSNSYTQFLQANRWVKEYLANAWEYKQKEKQTQDFVVHETEGRKRLRKMQILIFSTLDPVFRLGETWYMKSHKTREIISNSLLQFHPLDIRGAIKEKYTFLLKKYNIPLDSSFLKSLQ